MTVAVTITFTIRLGAQAEFMGLMSSHIADVIERDVGCLRSDALGDPSKPGKSMLVQVFESLDAFETYRASDLARGFDTQILDIVTGRSIAIWSEVFGQIKT